MIIVTSPRDPSIRQKSSFPHEINATITKLLWSLVSFPIHLSIHIFVRLFMHSVTQYKTLKSKSQTQSSDLGINDSREKWFLVQWRSHPDSLQLIKQLLSELRPDWLGDVQTWTRWTFLSRVLVRWAYRVVNDARHICRLMHKVEVLSSTFCTPTATITHTQQPDTRLETQNTYQLVDVV